MLNTTRSLAQSALNLSAAAVTTGIRIVRGEAGPQEKAAAAGKRTRQRAARKRSASAQKAAQTRKANARARSASAKQGARTRARKRAEQPSGVGAALVEAVRGRR